MNNRSALSEYGLILITGGSSGIGRAFISLIRNHSKSSRICNISRSKPGKEFFDSGGIHLGYDLTEPGAVGRLMPEIEKQVEETAKKMMLINNSGFGSYGNFRDLDIHKELNMIDLNVRSVVELTHGLLSCMQERGGTVLNVSSTAAWQPTPYLATYGAGKAFLLHWGLSLHEELRGSGVSVTTLCPGPTESQFFHRAGFADAPLSGRGESAESVAKTGLRAALKGKPLVVSGLVNKVLVGVGSKLPRVWQSRVAGFVLRKLRLESFQKQKENPDG